MRTISHDPFARTSLVSKRVPMPDFGPWCGWCGEVNFTSRGYTYLLKYGTQADDSGRVNWHDGHFCCKGCHDAYHTN